MLKKENPSKYPEFFEKIIYELDIIDKLNLIVEKNFYMHDRLPIISAATTLFMEKQYTAFVYLVTPQIEGLFRVLQQSIKGDMDLHWIIKTIDAEDQGYKKLMSFLDDLCSKQDLKMMVESLENYFNSMESEKNLNLLERYFQGEFNSILEWYGFTAQKNKFQETICSEKMYLLIWNEEPLEFETVEKVKMVDGTIKEMKVRNLNGNSLKYFELLSLLNKYNYVPLKWYEKYLSFIDHIEAAQKNILQKIGINYDEVEAEVEDE